MQTSNYMTYDYSNKKFIGVTLEQPVRNIVIYDDLTQVMPK